jgi:hypothetical protein
MINTMNGSRTMINFATTDSLAGPFGYLWTEHDDAGPVIVGSGWTTDPVELTRPGPPEPAGRRRPR